LFLEAPLQSRGTPAETAEVSGSNYLLGDWAGTRIW